MALWLLEWEWIKYKYRQGDCVFPTFLRLASANIAEADFFEETLTCLLYHKLWPKVSKYLQVIKWKEIVSQSADAQEVAVAEVMKGMVWRVEQSQGIVQAEGDCEAGRGPRVKTGVQAEFPTLTR